MHQENEDEDNMGRLITITSKLDGWRAASLEKGR
jgi:hypothetical protein